MNKYQQVNSNSENPFNQGVSKLKHREETQITEIRNESGHIITSFIEIKGL